MPDEVIIEPSDTQRAQRIESNPLQKVIFKEWCDMIDNVGRVDACFDLGDNIDGPNFKSKGFELWTSNMHQQVSTAADLLGMIKTNKYFGVQGSYYHVGENTSSDLAVIDSMEKCKTEFGTDLAVTVENIRIHLSHVISPTSSPVSKYTASNKEIDAANRNIAKLGNFQLLCRGHIHDIRDLIDHENNTRLIVCPCQKGRDAFLAKMGVAFVPVLGYILLTIKGSDITVEPHTYSLKPEHNIKEVSI